MNGVQNDDGQHLVGDDSHMIVLSSGEVHVSYADSTLGKLRYAVGVLAADKHTWTVQVIDQIDGFAGAFSHIIQVGGRLQVVNWWRTGGNDPVGDVTIAKP